MKRIVVLVAVAAVGIAATLAQAGEKAYVDAAGDSGTAPDLGNVVVTDTNGFLAFKIDGTLVPSSTFVIFIDTDRNQSAGEDGDELMVGVDQETDGRNFWFASRWSGSKWEDAGIDVTSQSFSGRHELGFRAANAGITGPFDFVVMSVKMVADAVEGRDRAPDSVVPWTYELARQQATTSVKAVIGQARLVPARPAAGRPLTIRMPVRRSDTGGPWTTAVATCNAQVEGRPVRATASFSNGSAACRLVVPRGTAGATGRGSITVGTGPTAVTKAFSFRIA